MPIVSHGRGVQYRLCLAQRLEHTHPILLRHVLAIPGGDRARFDRRVVPRSGFGLSRSCCGHEVVCDRVACRLVPRRPDSDALNVRVETRIDDKERVAPALGKQRAQADVQFRWPNPARQPAQVHHRKRSIRAPAPRGEVVEIRLRHLGHQGPKRTFRGLQQRSHTRDPCQQRPRSGLDAMDRDRPSVRRFAFRAKGFQSGRELWTQPAPRDPRLVEDPAPPRYHGRSPVRFRRTSEAPIQCLVPQDGPHKGRVLSLGAKAGHQLVHLLDYLAQKLLRSAGCFPDLAHVNRVKRFEVELFLVVHLEERVEGFRCDGDLKATADACHRAEDSQELLHSLRDIAHDCLVTRRPLVRGRRVGRIGVYGVGVRVATHGHRSTTHRRAE